MALVRYTQTLFDGLASQLFDAASHVVTADRDEAPGVEQDVKRISYRDTPEDLVREGGDIERRVPARAVHTYLDDCIILSRRRAIVFS